MKNGDIAYYKFSDRYYVRARVKTVTRTGMVVMTPIFFYDTKLDKDVPGYIGGQVRMKQEKVFDDIPADN